MKNIPHTPSLHHPLFGNIPYTTVSEFRAGDIIIFDEYYEKETKCGFETDRFLRVSKKDLKLYKNKKINLLPVGIVVHAPSTN